MRALQIDNLRELLGIRRMDRIPNAGIRELNGVREGLDERIDEGILRRFSSVERMERDRIAERIYVGECAGSCSVGRQRKRWIDTAKECLKKRGLDIKQEEEWSRIGVMVVVCKGEGMGRTPSDEPLTLTRCYSCGLPQLCEAFEGFKSVCSRTYNLKGIKEKFSVFLYLCFSFTVPHFKL